MNTLEIEERDIKVEYASCWDELTDKEFDHVMQNWLKVMDGKLTPDEFMVIVLYRFLGIERSPFQDWKDRRLSRVQLEDKFSNIWQLTQTLDWLIRIEETDKGPVPILNYTEIRNRLPVIKNKWDTELIGPGDGMVDITFGEYRRAWAYFDAYSKSKKHADLDKFVATLYRPSRENYNELKYRPDFDGQNREPFNPYLTEHYAELLAHVEFWKKYTIYLWFYNCDRFIKEEELELDGKTISFAPLFTKPRKKNEDSDFESLDENDLGLTSLLYFISESKLFGDIDQVDRTSYIQILTALLYWKQQTDKIKSSL